MSTSQTFQNIIFIAVPLAFAFVGIFIIVFHTKGNIRRRRAAASGRRRTYPASQNASPADGSNSGRNSFGSPRTDLHVMRFMVRPPPNARQTSFQVKLVQPSDEDDVENGTIQHDPVCAICLGDMDSEPIGEIKCGHRFHHACISGWLRKAPRPTCPLCKAIVGDEDPQENQPVA